MAKGTSEIRLRNIDDDLKKDLNKISDKRSFATLTDFMRAELRIVADRNIEELKKMGRW